MRPRTLSLSAVVWALAGVTFVVSAGACGASAPGDDAGSPTPASGTTAGAGPSAGGSTSGTSNGAGNGGSTAGASGGTTSGSSSGIPAADAGEDGTSPAPQPIRFVAVGDTGKANDGQRAVAAAMAATCAQRGCDFVLLLGDNFYPSGIGSPTDPQLKEKFEDMYAPIDAPFWVALGNHDYGANGAGTDSARAEHQVTYARTSKRWRMPARYYQFEAGPATFFALDTNAQMFRNDAKQKTDMAAWMAAAKTPWKIAFGHHPYRSNGTHGNAGNYEGQSWIPIYSGAGVKEFAENVYCGRVDLYISGHDHSQQWLEETCDGTALVVSGAGAESTAIVVDRNAYRYQMSELGFLYVELDARRLSTEFIDSKAQTRFSHVMTK